MNQEVINECSDEKRFSITQWVEYLGIAYPILALSWSWILGNSMYLVYLPWAPYAMLFLVIWAGVLTMRLCQKDKRDFFIGGRWGMLVIISGAAYAVLWMAFFVVGFGISEFSSIPVFFFVLYSMRFLIRKYKDQGGYLLQFCGALAFAYGCAVPPWYSAAVYSIYGFLTDRRTLFIALLVFLYAVANRFWESMHADNGEEMDLEEEYSKMFVCVSLPLLILTGLSIFVAYNLDVSSSWVYYSIAVSAGLLHLLNTKSLGFSMERLHFLAVVALILPVIIFCVC